MLSKTAAALLMSTALMTGAASAQTTATPPSTPPSSTTAPATMSPAASGKFLTDQGKDEFRASKFVGLDIYGPDNAKVGDIADVLIDPQGQAKAILIGVGGFLGIGEKNVAVPWSAVSWVMEKPAAKSASAAPTTTAPSTTGSTAPPAVTAAPTTGGVPATTAPALPPAEQAAYNGYPDHGTITLTKADLQNAPAFKYYSETHSSSGATK